jgi:hypothetical protein
MRGRICRNVVNPLDGHQRTLLILMRVVADQCGPETSRRVPDASFMWADPSLLVSGECNPKLHLPHPTASLAWDMLHMYAS